MAKIKDKLWNWGHLEGSHNEIVGIDCRMTPEQFAAQYGIKRAFIVSYGGNIQPPYHDLAKRLTALEEIKWSVLGDSSTPLPEAELGHTEDVIDASVIGNISGGVVDDFFSPVRIGRFTPDVLMKIKKALNDKGLDFWCVLYGHELKDELIPYLSCFDGITFWFWRTGELENMEATLSHVFELADGKPVMLGAYLYDYAARRPMDPAIFEKQISHYFSLLREGKIEGVIFCSSTVGDADLDANHILKQYVARYGDDDVTQ